MHIGGIGPAPRFVSMRAHGPPGTLRPRNNSIHYKCRASAFLRFFRVPARVACQGSLPDPWIQSDNETLIRDSYPASGTPSNSPRCRIMKLALSVRLSHYQRVRIEMSSRSCPTRSHNSGPAGTCWSRCLSLRQSPC